MNQTSFRVQLDCRLSPDDSLTVSRLTDCSVLVLDRLDRWSDILTRAVRERQTRGLPIWIVWNPAAAGTSVPSEGSNPWFAAREGQIEDWVQLYENLNPDCPLWKDPRFQELLSCPIELPSLKRVTMTTSDNSANARTGSGASINGWKLAFENSSLLKYNGNVWIFGSDLAGQYNSLPTSPIWVPLVDRLLTVSLASASPGFQKGSSGVETEKAPQNAEFSGVSAESGPSAGSDVSGGSDVSADSDDLNSSSARDSRQYNSLSRLLAVAGLGLLLILFFQFGRFKLFLFNKTGNNKRTVGAFAGKKRLFAWENYWTGVFLTFLNALVLLVMAIQISWTPVLKVKPAVLFLIDDSLSLNLPESSCQPFGDSRRKYLIEQLNICQAALKERLPSCQIFSARLSQPEQVEPVDRIDDWQQSLASLPFDARETRLGDALEQSVFALKQKIDPRSLRQVFIFSDGRIASNANEKNETTGSDSQKLTRSAETGSQEAASSAALKSVDLDFSVSSICLGDLKPIPDLRWKTWTLEPELLARQPVLIQPVLESDSLAGQKVWVELTANPVSKSGEPLLLARKSLIIQEKETARLRPFRNQIWRQRNLVCRTQKENRPKSRIPQPFRLSNCSLRRLNWASTGFLYRLGLIPRAKRILITNPLQPTQQATAPKIVCAKTNRTPNQGKIKTPGRTKTPGRIKARLPVFRGPILLKFRLGWASCSLQTIRFSGWQQLRTAKRKYCSLRISRVGSSDICAICFVGRILLTFRSFCKTRPKSTFGKTIAPCQSFPTLLINCKPLTFWFY